MSWFNRGYRTGQRKSWSETGCWGNNQQDFTISTGGRWEVAPAFWAGRLRKGTGGKAPLHFLTPASKYLLGKHSVPNAELDNDCTGGNKADFVVVLHWFSKQERMSKISVQISDACCQGNIHVDDQDKQKEGVLAAIPWLWRDTMT